MFIMIAKTLQVSKSGSEGTTDREDVDKAIEGWFSLRRVVGGRCDARREDVYSERSSFAVGLDDLHQHSLVGLPLTERYRSIIEQDQTVLRHPNHLDRKSTRPDNLRPDVESSCW